MNICPAGAAVKGDRHSPAPAPEATPAAPLSLSRKRIGTSISAATGRPSRDAGRKRHWRTAATAASSRSAWPLDALTVTAPPMPVGGFGRLTWVCPRSRKFASQLRGTVELADPGIDNGVVIGSDETELPESYP